MTEPFSVHVYSLVSELAGKDVNNADILDIEGPWLPREEKSHWGLVVLAAFLCACALACWLRRKTPEAAPVQAVKIVPGPGKIALAELTRLLDERLCERGLFDRFFVRLSDIMRRYVESRFNCPVISQTTEQFLTATAQNALFDPAQEKMLGAFLGQCDTVKFAGITIRTEVALASGENCRRFIVTSMEEAG